MAEFDLMFEQMFGLNSKFDLQAEFELTMLVSHLITMTQCSIRIEVRAEFQIDQHAKPSP